MPERPGQLRRDALVIAGVIEPEAGVDGDHTLELAAVLRLGIECQQAAEGVTHQQGRRLGPKPLLDEGAQFLAQIAQEPGPAPRHGIAGPRRCPIGQGHGVARGVIPHPVGVVHRDDDEGGDSRIEPGPQGPGDADNLQQTLLPVKQIEHGEPSPGLAFIFLGQGDAVLPRLPQQGRMVGEALGVVEHVCLGRRECDHGEQQDDESCHGMNQDCVASLGDPP